MLKSKDINLSLVPFGNNLYEFLIFQLNPNRRLATTAAMRRERERERVINNQTKTIAALSN